MGSRGSSYRPQHHLLNWWAVCHSGFERPGLRWALKRAYGAPDRSAPRPGERYSQRSFVSLIDVTRNCGSGVFVFTVSFDFVSGASSRSILVSVVVFDSPAGINIPVTSTL